MEWAKHNYSCWSNIYSKFMFFNFFFMIGGIIQESKCIVLSGSCVAIVIAIAEAIMIFLSSLKEFKNPTMCTCDI